MTKKEHRTLIRIIVTLIWFAALLGTDRAGLLRGAGTYGRFLLYFLPYLLIGYDVLLKALRNIIRGQVFDEHFLMMIATFAAFGLGLMGDEAYSEALAVMLFYQIGELFQDVAVGKSRKSIADMMSIAPESANVERNGRVEVMDPEEAHIGDILLIKAGEKVPLDGTVIEGESYLNTAALTGESVPRRVKAGDPVISGCVNGEGTLRVRVEKEYEDSTVARILDLVENASSRKARLENFITRFARVYTPVVTIGAVLLAVLPPLFHIGGLTYADSIRRACNFLIVSCPCALVISVPLGFFGGIGASSKIGVLVKGSNYLEAASGLSTLVFDKTGTLTKGEFRVQKVVPSAGESDTQNLLGTPEEAQRRLLETAALGESYSNHPIARSIREALGENTSLDTARVTDAKEAAGHGIEALLDGKKLLIGNLSLMTSNHIDAKPAEEPGTIIYTALDGHYLGYIVISDTVKEGAKEAIREIKEAGVSKTVMLTGDRKGAAVQVAETLGIDEVHSDLLPADKVSEVEKLIAEAGKAGGKLGFVGDGINDAPVLMRADVGFAMGALGSDAAIEAADIVLMDDDIRKIPKVIRIARKTMRIVKSNVVFAIAVKLLILALSVFGLASMWAAVFGDVGVAILCILNSMRTLHESR
ncbi:heavy metal translocating P-type ATPase [Porcincola intestinalis]|uniref:heavy metal translocating P-type ATPase n=1 Tax=Porcincola intestinalis TaxID=2606632 RepID=UPI0023F2D0D3|nr:heavy metal translocating P-type ATPase [Porcincola intestinalis]MCI6767685.1 cadmium-translocating P-type ATPase [Lachnospiraceae bacterium]MDD7060453.1 heavy metal translocating P-type ATPase [Porcincola intestinalis]MDY5282473.1 heavy metal translocating P-type ATPase [Porcincola intestinalis]